MSDSIHWFVVSCRSDEQARVWGRSLLDWLIERKIVAAQVCPRSGLYLPGDAAQGFDRAIDYCGVQLVQERTVFHAGDSGLEGLACPSCQQVSAADEIAWDEAVGNWFAGQDDATLNCPACQRAGRLHDWQFLPMPWAFGNLGVGFCNWWPDESMIEALLAELGAEARQVRQHT
ncbi:sugar ABC transporter ATPase component [Ectopseudomonas mendocina]|uniref:Sugar ABC transporter ATPase component n=1 Tax=Ectopseudomonas mendocina TaxID=300 RepID=A0A379J0L1_ECTME|nr:hypothetical protein [Pseudomonas mendocina]SUD41593.1 sugar ABC transporter ATPase component [Pseudomonas mendocina]